MSKQKSTTTKEISNSIGSTLGIDPKSYYTTTITDGTRTVKSSSTNAEESQKNASKKW